VPDSISPGDKITAPTADLVGEYRLSLIIRSNQGKFACGRLRCPSSMMINGWFCQLPFDCESNGDQLIFKFKSKEYADILAALNNANI